MKAVEAYIEKGIIGILTPLIMEFEFSKDDKERMELIRGATQIFAEMTDIKDVALLVTKVSYLHSTETNCSINRNSGKLHFDSK